MTLPYLTAFILGLISTLHCLGMCGGIIAALSISLPKSVHAHTSMRFRIILTYNLGRIFSYTIAGILAGSAGYLFVNTTKIQSGHLFLQYLAAIFLIFLGLHIAGYFPGLKRLETLGLRVWSIIQPVGKQFLPVDSSAKSFIIGAIWGWLPCGLVYSVLLWTISSADPVRGGIYMFAFGLGTLPGMVSAGIAGNWLQQITATAQIRRLAGTIIILFGAASPFLMNVHENHANHKHQVINYPAEGL